MKMNKTVMTILCLLYNSIWLWALLHEPALSERMKPIQSDVRKCPCKFVIVSSVTAPPLDFTVQSFGAGSQRQLEKVDRVFSRTGQTSKHAFRRDGSLSYHKIEIPLKITAAISVRESGNVSVSPSSRVSIIQEIHQLKPCPVLLPQHPPRNALDDLPVRIVGGQYANETLAKSLVFFKTTTSGGSAYCSGTIIGKRRAVTAAHCAISTSSEVYIGGTIGNPPNGIENKVVANKTHPEYNPDSGTSVQYDLAIIDLQDDVPFPEAIAKVNKDNMLSPETVVRAVGYGVTTPNTAFATDDFYLFQVDFYTLSFQQCELQYEDIAVPSSDRNICAGRSDRDGCGVWYV